MPPEIILGATTKDLSVQVSVNRPTRSPAVGIPGPPGPQGPPGSAGGINWTIAAESLTAAVNTAYRVEAASLIIITLPVTAAPGDRVGVFGTSAAPWRLAQPAGARVQIGNLTTTAGVSGRVDSVDRGDSIFVVHQGGGLWLAEAIGGSVEVS